MRELNPPPRLERPVSSADRRTGHDVGREALESSSAVLQTAANPSQLPAQRKRPGISSRRLASKRHLHRRAWRHRRNGNTGNAIADSPACRFPAICFILKLARTRNIVAPNSHRGKTAKLISFQQRILCRGIIVDARTIRSVRIYSGVFEACGLALKSVLRRCICCWAAGAGAGMISMRPWADRVLHTSCGEWETRPRQPFDFGITLA